MLSRAPTGTGSLDKELYLMHVQLYRKLEHDSVLEDLEEVDHKQYLPASEARFVQIREKIMASEPLQALTNTFQRGFPDAKQDLPMEIREFWNFRDELTVQDRLIFKGERIFIPPTLRREMLQRVQSSHVGADACIRKTCFFGHAWHMKSETLWRNVASAMSSRKPNQNRQ